MTDIDLSGPREILESFMVDECIITRDVNGTRDAVLDETTGQLTQPEPLTIYAGKCKFRPLFVPVETSEAGQTVQVSRYQLDIPLPSTPVLEPQDGDIAMMVSARRDPNVVGQPLRITEVTYKTFAIQRTMRCEKRAKVGDRP